MGYAIALLTAVAPPWLDMMLRLARARRKYRVFQLALPLAHHLLLLGATDTHSSNDV